MGGCTNYCQTDVEFEQIDMKISKKNVQTLERYSQGAIARRETTKLKTQCIRQITGKYIKSISILQHVDR